MSLRLNETTIIIFSLLCSGGNGGRGSESSIALIIELFEITVFFLICRSLDVDISFRLVLFLLPITVIIANLPVAVFGLGTREAAILLLFYGISSKAKLLGCSLLYSLIFYVFPAFVGLSCTVPFLYMLMHPRNNALQNNS